MSSSDQAFTDPFRYRPHPLVKKAAAELMERIERCELESIFAEGKMLGVLVYDTCPLRYIAAFSGNVAGRSIVEGFVPPVFDLTPEEGEFRRREAEISEINRRIETLSCSGLWKELSKELDEATRHRDEETESLRNAMAASRKRRAVLRTGCTDPELLEKLIRESQSEKSRMRRLKKEWEARIQEITARRNLAGKEIEKLRNQRASMSERLQNWIFSQYIVHNALGEEASIAEIFSSEGLVPPGGTGECAAPKLLEYAWRNGLRPVAMGEFWYGISPDTAVRAHGRFYPSCTSKCGPLLKFMLKGTEIIKDNPQHEEPLKIYEDDAVIAVEKPCGMPSVPGLDGRTSLLEWLQEHYPETQIEAVHRLDMDTSGVMIFAKCPEAAVRLRKEFEEHRVRKTYMARLCAGAPGTTEIPSEGSIRLPLSPDYDERPRQKADFIQGKDAVTEYETVDILPDGTADMLLHPVTGRTHQLRVHCAHHLGLGRPILGDLLYGSHSIFSPDTTKKEDRERLCLHALSISFRHPFTDEMTAITSDRLCYRPSTSSAE